MGSRGASSATAKSGAGARKQKDHLDSWHEPPSLAQQLGDYTEQQGAGTTELLRQVSAVKSYSGSSYYDIRDAWYNNKVGTKEYEQAQAIETMIANSPKWDGGTLFRGARLDESIISQYQKGAVIDMRGMSSWSSSQNTANNFAKTSSYSTRKSVVFRTKGTNKGTSITHLSKFGKGESEVLVSGKATWTVTKVTKTKAGKYIIDVVENP